MRTPNSRRLSLAVALAFVGCVSACATGSAGLLNIENDATSFHNNGAFFYSRLSTSEIGGSAGDRAYELHVVITPTEPRYTEFVFPSGRKIYAGSFWARLPKGGSNLLVTLPPGEYYIHSVQQHRGYGTQFAAFFPRRSFTVTGDKINYVGDIEIQVDYDKKIVRLTVTDRYKRAVDALSSSHPQLSSRFNVTNGSRQTQETTERAF